MTLVQPRIYISHAWGGESEEIVREVVRVFEQNGLPVIYDKKDLGYRQSIREFMVNLGQADIIIIVVSNKYLHSEYCMFELLQIYDNNRELDRIFPIVLDEVQIAKSSERLELVKYWEQETRQLEQKIRELESIANIEGISDDLNLYQTIRNRIARLTAILKDINTLNIQIHRKSDYSDLLAAIRRRLERPESIQTPAQETIISSPSHAPRVVARHRRQVWPWILVAILPLLGFAAFKWLRPGPTPFQDEPVTNRIPTTPQDSVLQVAVQDDIETSPVSSGNQPSRSGERQVPALSSGASKEEPPREKMSEPNPKVELPTTRDLSSGMTQQTTSLQEEEGKTAKPGPDLVTKRTIDLHIPRQMIEVRLSASLSSNRNRVGDEVQLISLSEVRHGAYMVIRSGAPVKGEVTRAVSSLDHVRGELAFRILKVRAENGQWLDLVYPEYSDSRRGEVSFKKGTELPNIVLKEASVIWTLEE